MEGRGGGEGRCLRGACGGEGNVCVRGEAWPAVAPLAPGCPARRGHPAPGYLAALQLYLGAVASGGRSAALSVGCAPRRLSRLSSRHVRSEGGALPPLSIFLPFLLFCLFLSLSLLSILLSSFSSLFTPLVAFLLCLCCLRVLMVARGRACLRGEWWGSEGSVREGSVAPA